MPAHPHFDLDVRLGPSRRQRLWLLSSHVTALAAVWLSGVPAPWPVVASLVVAAHGVGAWCDRDRHHGWCIRYRGGVWSLHDAGGRLVATGLLPSTWTSPWLCLLHWRRDGSVLALPVWRDSLPPDDYRRLRVRLRWG